MHPGNRSLHLVALFTGLVPILCVHLTYFVSAAQGYVPWCFPYVESCTSISATGRYGIAFYLFKGTMIPAAVLLMFFWALTAAWLRQSGDDQRFARTILWLGIIGAMFLIVYTVALGAAGDMLRLQRRIGITIYFALTFFAQLLLTYRLIKLVDTAIYLYLRLANYAVLAVGLCSVFLGFFMANYPDYEDAFEWVAALLIQIYFLVVWVQWKRMDFAFSLTFKDSG